MSAGEAPEEARDAGPAWLEGRRFAIVVLAILLATNLPYVYRLLAAPPGYRMLGSNFRNLGDILTYVAWMKQAAQGHELFILLYDPAPQPRVLFLPLFLVLGRLGRWLSLDLMLVLHLARVAASAALLLAARRFVRRAPPGERAVAFGTLALATGLPGIFPEACPISSMFDSPLAAAAWPAILLAGDAWLRALQGGSGRDALATGAWGAYLLLVHPYDAVSLGAVVAATAVFAAITISVRRAAALAARVALPMVPAAAIVAYGLAANPSLRSWAETERTIVGWELLSFATLPLLALAGTFAAWRGPERRTEGALLALWVATSLALVLLPVPSQRRYIQGMMAPLALLAARGHAAIRRTGWRRPAGYLVAASFAGGIVMITLDVFLPATPAEAAGIRGVFEAVIHRYVPDVVVDDLRALERLPEGLVMAPETLDTMVPPFSGRQVFAGHNDQTPGYGARLAVYRAVAEGRIGGAELARLGVRFVLVDARAAARDRPGLREIRRSSRTVLYEVEPAIWESARTNAAASPSS